VTPPRRRQTANLRASECFGGSVCYGGKHERLVVVPGWQADVELVEVFHQPVVRSPSPRQRAKSGVREDAAILEDDRLVVVILRQAERPVRIPPGEATIRHLDRVVPVDQVEDESHLRGAPASKKRFHSTRLRISGTLRAKKGPPFAGLSPMGAAGFEPATSRV
jgi:hypothetical protein